MLLDDLAQLVVSIRNRAREHGTLLRGNETATRYALIDPMLAALGWDLGDPTQVVAEYRVGSGRADYALLAGRAHPPLVIEAKALGADLRNGVEQSIGYCLQDGIDYFAVTNGGRWEVYEPHRKVRLDDKVVLTFDVNEPEHHVCLRMLWLWAGNFRSGGPAAVPSIAPPSTATPPPRPPVTPPVTDQPADVISTSGSLRGRPGLKTPNGEYRKPILRVLEKLGGSARSTVVLDSVFAAMRGRLSEYDLANLASGPARWRNAAEWERYVMTQEGLLSGDTNRGVWQMTEKGRRVLHP